MKKEAPATPGLVTVQLPLPYAKLAARVPRFGQMVENVAGLVAAMDERRPAR